MHLLTIVSSAPSNSNTKVSLILSYAQALRPFREIIESSPTPNAISVLEGLDQNTGCPLEYAADMFIMLNEGILQRDQIKGFVGTVVGANISGEVRMIPKQHGSELTQGGTPVIHLDNANSGNGLLQHF
jgi:hypothetical protein